MTSLPSSPKSASSCSSSSSSVAASDAGDSHISMSTTRRFPVPPNSSSPPLVLSSAHHLIHHHGNGNLVSHANGFVSLHQRSMSSPEATFAALLNSQDGDVHDDRERTSVTDAFGFGSGSSPRRLHLANPSHARMPCERESEVYNMSHRRRGLALIFNHKDFMAHLGLKERKGTNADRDNLKNTLTKLDFEVRVFDDCTYRELDRKLFEVANENHTDADCLWISVLTHGELGSLYACDHVYKASRLWEHFNAERCPTLAGKPKLFFIQACQGDQLDCGVQLKRVACETDSNAMSYKIPTHADFLIAYSTIPGFYSWRNTTAGSWFVQALCQVLQREGDRRDLLSLLTRVSRRVAFDFQSNTPGDPMMHEKKQIPCITSMLTRDIVFLPKRLTRNMAAV